MIDINALAPGAAITLRGVPLEIVEVFPIYRTRDGEPFRLAYAVRSDVTAKRPRMVALHARASGLRVTESAVRALRQGSAAELESCGGL